MQPWHCMVCDCFNSGETEKALPYIVIDNIKNVYMRSPKNEKIDNYQISWEINNNPPPWVHILRRETIGDLATTVDEYNQLNNFLQENELQGVALIEEIDTQPL